MPTYKVKVSGGGDLRSVEIVADNEQTAINEAKSLGNVLSAKKQSSLSGLFKPSLRVDERIIFLQRLSMMVESKVGLGRALKVMEQAFSGSIKRVSTDLHARVERGADFGQAIIRMSKDFPETTAALINSGVRGNDLPAALKNASDFEIEMDYIRRNSSKGLASAVFTFLLSIGLILGTTFFIGPAVLESQLFKQTPGEVDVDWVFMIGYWVSGLMIFILAVTLGLLGLRYILKPLAPGFADRIIVKIPIYRDLVLAKNNYTIFHSLGLLINSGVRIEEALKLAYEAAPKGEVKNDLSRATNAVRNGKSWPMAMKTLHPTDIAALSTAQDREQTARSVNAVAKQYRNIYTQRIQEVVPGLQLLAALFMAIGGGLIFAMVILPMLLLTQNLL